MGALADLRSSVELALLDAAADTDWTVLAGPVDQLAPPTFVIEWADPWVPERATTCQYRAGIAVRCVAGRLEPSPGIEVLELMVEAAIGALDVARFPVREVSPPRPWVLGNVTYLAAAIATSAMVTIAAPAPAVQPATV